MPNNILITPGSASIQFSGSAANTIRLQVEPSGSVAFYGNSGTLFGITDTLSGSLMSVNDISGLPILEVFSDDRVVMGTYNRNTLVVTGSRVGIDKAEPTTDLDISGSVFITGSLRFSGGGITGSLFGTSSWAQSASVAANVGPGTLNSIGLFNTSNSVSSSVIFQSATGSSIGVGTSTPLRRVEITGDGSGLPQLRLSYVSGQSALEIMSNAASTGELKFGAIGGANNLGQVIYNNANNSMAFFTNTQQRITIDSSGRVGIGTTAPSASLHVQGNVSASAYTSSIVGAVGFFGTASYALQTAGAGGGVTSITAGSGLSGGTITSTGTIALDTSSAHFISGARFTLPVGTVSSSVQINTGSFSGSFIGVFTGSLLGTSSRSTTSSYALQAASASYSPPSFVDNLVTVGLPGSSVDYNSIKTAVDNITDASATNTYTVRVYPGVYIEDTITLKSYVAVKGDSSISTIVSASNPSSSIFIMADQSMVIDMQIQGTTALTSSAIIYSSPTTPQTNAIAYVENVRFGTNYTNAKVIGSGSNGNCILQCSNVKYGGFTSGSKSFDVGFYVTSGSDGGIGRMQLRNVTSTNGGVAGTDNDQIFALADAPGCTFIVNGCLLTRATGTARGTAFKVYNGGQLRLTGVNFQRWIRGIWAPQTGSAPSIDAIALNFENCTTDVAIEHTGSIGKVQGTDNFLKTQISLSSSLYQVGKDPRRITVGTKGADFSSISASVAWITDSSENNRYVIEVGPGQFTEKTIDLTGKPYVSIVGSNIQTTQIFPSSSNQHIIKMGVNNEVSFLSLANAGAGYAAIYVDDVGDFAQAHKVSIYDCDIGIQVVSRTQDTQFYGEYVDINGTFTYGTYVSASNDALCLTNIENYYLFPSGCAAIGNYATHPSASLSLHAATFQGDNTANSVAIKVESGAELEGSGLDIQNWDYGVQIPNVGNGPNFRLVGTMIHGSSTYDIENLNATTRGRFQGVSDHTKINNNSSDLYWNFLDDTDGENDVTRKLSVTFAEGTHTDATTLIFKGSPMGVMQGGVITTGSGFGITAASGFGYLQDTIDTEVYKRLDWIDGNLTLTANSENYIYVNDAGTLTSSPSIPDNFTNIILGRVVTNDTKVEFIDQTPYNGEHMSNRLSTFNREALGPVYSVGSIVTENVTPFKLNVTQGTYFFSENKFTPSGTSSINLTQYYPSASVWARYTSSIVPNNLYASASTLVPMSSSAYTKHTVYVVGDGADEKYFLVINSNQYSTLVATENADLPTIPTYFSEGVVPLAAVYVQSGSANITQIQDIRPIIGFRAAGVNASSVHGNLLGLDADDHLQYLRTDGTRTVTGNMNFGGNNITNVSSLTTTSITGSLLGTASWAQNATTSSFTPVGPGTLNSIALFNSLTTISSSLMVQSSSNIGIGTTSPSAKLHINDTASATTPQILITNNGTRTGLRFGSSSLGAGVQANIYHRTDTNIADWLLTTSAGSTANWNFGPIDDSNNAIKLTVPRNPGVARIYSSTTHSFSIGANNVTDIIWVTGSGNVGMGTTSPQARLHTTTTTNNTVGLFEQLGGSPGQVPVVRINRPNNITGGPTTASAALYITDHSTNIPLQISTHLSASILTVSGSGNIGIGTTNPTVALDVTGRVRASDRLQSPAVMADGVAGLAFKTSDGSDRVIINNSGNVGIGTTSPSATLQIQGNVSASSYTSSISNAVGFLGTASFAVSASWAPGGAGTVTSITAGSGLSGGTITSTGTIALDTGSAHFITGSVSVLNLKAVVSSSAQINTGSFTGSFFGTLSGSVFGTSSWAQNVVSASFATTASAATSITFTPTSASFANTASAATSITFIPSSASFATTASAATSITFTPTTASYATSGSWLRNKAGNIVNTLFAGNPRKAAVNFTSPFPNTNYAIVITGEDARTWTVEGKVAGGFTASANSNTALAGTTYWVATAYGET